MKASTFSILLTVFLPPLPLSAVPTNGLTAYWNFDSSLTQNHVLASGNMAPEDSHHLNLKQGNPSLPVTMDPNGFIGSAARFSQTAKHYLTLQNGGEVIEDDPFSKFTYSVRFKINRVPVDKERFMILETSPNYTLSLGLRATSATVTNLQFYTDTASTRPSPRLNFNIPNETIPGRWFHAIATWDGVRFTARVNERSQMLEIPYDDTLVPFNNFSIGTYRDATGRYFDGLIDELAIWNRVLTNEELRGLQTAIRVNSIGDEIDPNEQVTTLREAIRTAPEYATIFFDPSLSGKTIQLSESELLINKSLTIDASDLPKGIIIDGGGNGNLIQDEGESRCFKISDGLKRRKLTVSLHNLTLQNGNENLYNEGESVILHQCHILNGRALNGPNAKAGGIYSPSGYLELNSCTVSHNQTSGTAGAGIYIKSGSLMLKECTISHNDAHGSDQTDSGIFNQSGSLTVDSCKISRP